MSLKNIKPPYPNHFQFQNWIVGLWQIADMEKEDQQLDLPKTASYMDAYIDAGFTAFDMADHYGSSEIIAGICKKQKPQKGCHYDVY